jgi:hypothetical protein
MPNCRNAVGGLGHASPINGKQLPVSFPMSATSAVDASDPSDNAHGGPADIPDTGRIAGHAVRNQQTP